MYSIQFSTVLNHIHSLEVTSDRNHLNWAARVISVCAAEVKEGFQLQSEFQEQDCVLRLP